MQHEQPDDTERDFDALLQELIAHTSAPKKPRERVEVAPVSEAPKRVKVTTIEPPKGEKEIVVAPAPSNVPQSKKKHRPVSEVIDEVMAELHKRGVQFAPASGRQYYSLLKSFPEYEDKFIFVSDNGTIVRQHGKELFSDIIEHDVAREIFNSVNDVEGVYNVLCGKETVYLLKDKQPEAQMAELKKYFRAVEIVDSFDDIADEPIKISFFTPIFATHEPE